MALAETTLVAPAHITLGTDGKARIEGTRIKVVFLVRCKAQGLTAEEIQELHPQLSLAQIYAAFSYYYDHQQAFDELIAEQYRIEDEARRNAVNQVTRRELQERWDKLHAEGKLPARDAIIP